ncbi:MAG TPA: hypothetical protein PK671_00960 [Candidatus Obscuribacter sp.]|nr:hypothetical protein [Candidatus Obscuribacter sp.]
MLQDSKAIPVHPAVKTKLLGVSTMKTANITVNAADFGLNAKFGNLVDQFLALPLGNTGWTWRDAAAACLERGGTIDFSETPLGRFFATTVSKGWTWGAAIGEALEAGHEVDLNELPFEAFIKADEATVEDGLVSIADADFERVTGWTAGDAIEMAAECRRDDRLFKGGRRLH